jgi:ligand-binding sensor domain-containing protein
MGVIQMKAIFLYCFSIIETGCRYFIFLCNLLTCFVALHAQDHPLFFQRISLEQGLSQTIVENILQDKRGFMWFSSEDGLNKYDGYTFTVIRNDPGNTNSLSHNTISFLYEDRLGRLWVGTNNGGLNRYDPDTESFIRYRYDPGDPYSLSNDIILTICEDHTGALWIGTSNGLNKLVTETDAHTQQGIFTRYYSHSDDTKSLNNNTITALRLDDRGNLLIGTASGLNVIKKNDLSLPASEKVTFYDLPEVVVRAHPELNTDPVNVIFTDNDSVIWIGMNTGLYKLFNASGNREDTFDRVIRYSHDQKNNRSLSHDQVFAIFEERSGAFWIGTNGGGLNLFDRKTATSTHYRHDPRNIQSISYNEILSIYEDRSGNLWIGTYGGGINKIDRGRKHFVHYNRNPENTNSLSESIVWSIYEDVNDILWIGTHGGGLNRYDRKSDRYSHFRADPVNPHALQSDFVRCLIEDRGGYIWLGTNTGGISRFDTSRNTFTTYRNEPGNLHSLSDNTIRSIYEDRDGTMWIGTYSAGLNKMIPANSSSDPPSFRHYRHDPANPHSISSDYIRTLVQDRAGIFWIGTYGGGLNKFDREREIFTHYRADKSKPNSLNNDYVFTIHEDKNGILWLGTWGGGLNRFDPATGIFTQYTEKQGLPSNAIYGILDDDEGNLWLSTNNGLSKFDPVRETFRNYKVSDGLQSREFNGGAYYKSRKGEFFFGGVNGFNAFFPLDIRDNPYIPPVVITSFKKLNQDVSFNKPVTDIRDIQLSYRDYVFSFEFAALDYTVPEENRYAYKMERLDEDWIFTDAGKRYANYTTLPPGKYVFRVKASNNDGVWNEEGIAIAITITPPFWKTWWFMGLIGIGLLSLGYVAYSKRLKTIEMKIELQTAHDMQMSIMPQEDPDIQGLDISGICIPANEVGGDFFDYLWLDDDRKRIGLVVGDVSGKAMKAAMIAVMSSGMISAKAGEHTTVSEIMTRINRPLFLKIQKGVFVALCIAEIDCERKCVCFSNAGLNKPVLKSNGRICALEGGRVRNPIGMLPNSQYEETVVQLKPGDILVFYTDGVSEARDHAKNLYGDERLYSLLEKTDTKLLTAKEIKKRIILDIKQFTGTASRADDMTVVVAKICG